MGKYTPLQKYLWPKKKKTVKLSFFEIELIIDEKLPKSAYNIKAWWSNNISNYQANSWLDIGWRVDEVDLEKEFVIFKKSKSRFDNIEKYIKP